MRNALVVNTQVFNVHNQGSIISIPARIISSCRTLGGSSEYFPGKFQLPRISSYFPTTKTSKLSLTITGRGLEPACADSLGWENWAAGK